jgi:hypothetical protein
MVCNSVQVGGKFIVLGEIGRQKVIASKEVHLYAFRCIRIE